jgi:hypothetical protein
VAPDPRALSTAERLRALAAGDPSTWVGIDDSLDEEAIAGVLGPPREPGLLAGMLGGSPTMFHDYPPAPGAPGGVRVWFEDGVAVAVEIAGARLVQPVDAAGVETVDVIESAFGPEWRQELHPARGLVVHRRGAEVGLVFGLAPFTVEEWATDPLRIADAPRRGRSR